MKWHFVSSIIAMGFIALIAITDNEKTRFIYVIPAIIFFYLTLVLFAVEYDRLMLLQWEKREKKIMTKVKRDAYVDSFREYSKQKKKVQKDTVL